MTEITQEHVEWVIVDRLRQMLDRPSEEFKATETYALFTSTLCWVMQHIRIPEREVRNDRDHAVRALWERLETTPVSESPWEIQAPVVERIEREGLHRVAIPPAHNFAEHNVARFLKNLRDATAHGDGRNMSPFNSHGLLLGFTFSCSERERGRVTWEGEVTLLRSDMQRIGTELCRLYCNALQHGSSRWGKDAFEADAASIREEVA